MAELAVEGLGDEGAEPGGDVDAAFGAEAGEALAQGGLDADLEHLVTRHVMTW